MLKLFIEVWILDSAGDHDLDRLIQRRNAAIVKIGIGELDVANRGRLELAVVLWVLGEIHPTMVLLVRGLVRPDAGVAEDLEPVLGLLADRALIPLLEFVPGRVSRLEGSQE